MANKIYITPPPTAKPMFIAVAILGTLFLIFGIVLLSSIWGDMDEERIPISIFFLIWCSGCIAIVVHAIKVLKLIKKGKIEVGGMEESKDSFAPRLRELEALKKDGLIDDEEYDKKRAEIMNEKW